MIFCVGLTGTIASGKSTVATLFEHFSIPIIYADNIARELTNPGQPAYDAIVEKFGNEILQSDLNLNRAQLRSFLIANNDHRFWLETLLHPLIREEIKLRAYQAVAPYCMIEIPLLLSTEHYPYINRVLLIDAPLTLQIERLCARDGCSKQEAIRLIELQPNFQERLAFANDIINNDGDIVDLQHRVADLHHQYTNLAKTATS